MNTRSKSILATCLLALSAGAGVAQAETKVTFWHSFNKSSGEAIDQIIANFEAANPEIDIEGEYIGNYNDIVAKLQAAIPAKRAPDAVIMEVTRYGLFADRGVLLDLTSYLDADPLKDELFDFAREVGVYEGKNYIVPFNSSTPVFYANIDLLKQAGYDDVPEMKSWAQLEEVAQTVTDALGGDGIYGMVAPGQFARWGLIMDNDSDLIDTVSGEILIDAPRTVEAYQWMASLVHDKKLASPDGVADESKGKELFTQGKAALMFDSTGSYGGLKSAMGDNLAVLPMPCNVVCRVPIGGAGIGILSTTDADVQAAAYKFMSFAASAESNAIWFAATGYMPINKQTAAQPLAVDALATQPGIDVAIGQLDFARGRPRPPVVTWMRATEYDMWQAMALGQRDVTETLTEFAASTRQEAERIAR